MLLGLRTVSMSSLALVVTSAFRASGTLGLGCLGGLYIHTFCFFAMLFYLIFPEWKNLPLSSSIRTDTDSWRVMMFDNFIQQLVSRTAIASCARFSGPYNGVGTRFSASVTPHHTSPDYFVNNHYRARNRPSALS